jgi:ribosome-associated protein
MEPVMLDVRELCSYANYLLLVSGRSDRQVDAIADAVQERLKGQATLSGHEGIGSGHWVLLDYGDLLVHVFHHPVREHFDLEGLWSDAPLVLIDIPPDAHIQPEDLYPH